MKFAERMRAIPPYLFAELDRKKRQVEARGQEVISFAIGDPDLPTPPSIVEAARRAVADASNHRYPPYAGLPDFLRAAARWLRRRFGVEMDPEQELLALIGTKEGIAHLSLAALDAGAVALCPDPAYPVYAISARLAGADVYHLPLTSDSSFLPDLGAVPREVLERARLLWLCYPNNPTGAVAPLDFLKEAVAFARKNDLLLCYDAAYSEIVLEGEPSPSVLQVAGARDCAVEFHSLSKTYNMTGWRVGFVAGCREAIKMLGNLKSNLDSSLFGAVQQAGIVAMNGWPEHLQPLLKTYRGRRDALCAGLRSLGFRLQPPRATFYVWMLVPGGDDVAFASQLVERAGVLVTPGSGFGSAGRGYVRFSLTQPKIEPALERLRAAGVRG